MTYDNLILLCQKLVDSKKLTEAEFGQIKSQIQRLPSHSAGIVAVCHELVEGRLTCAFHLHHYKDINTTFASSVLRRQSTVHNVIYSDHLAGCLNVVARWKKHPEVLAACSRTPPPNLLEVSKLSATQKNIALIAHDGKKLDMCAFAVANLNHILAFDRILATGTTGTWLKKIIKGTASQIRKRDPSFMTEAEIEGKFILCESGPKGGDVQIAQAALQGLCHRIIFFTDPMSAHPHEPDINFFQQAVESIKEPMINMATNEESAKYILHD